MKQYKLLATGLLVGATVILAACGGPAAAVRTTPATPPAEADAAAPVAVEATSDPAPCPPANTASSGIAEARLYVEYNATDGDLGVHGEFGDDGWSALCVYAPDGKQILDAIPQSQLGELTVGTIFFESREPPLDEFAFDELEPRFPEGQYAVRALSHDGTILAGAALFSHDIPAEPVITAPDLAEEEETAGDALVAPGGLVVTWQDVTETVSGDPLIITAYEVIVTKAEHDDPHGFSRPVYDVHLPPNRTSLQIADGFLETGAVYELEVLALEQSGNQTIAVGFFQTE